MDAEDTTRTRTRRRKPIRVWRVGDRWVVQVHQYLDVTRPFHIYRYDSFAEAISLVEAAHLWTQKMSPESQSI